ncbi:MAG: chemotaxis protein CheW [Leptolyngbyaceae cyanobacterium MAG.088]|nr:chemotaxis protein CheW [Leptolyngbyaceae cyanobacterium MAG.088]
MHLPTQELSQSSATAKYLKFNLLADMTALLPITQLAAVLKVEATHITAIPHLPAWVIGVYNWRGEVLWIVDMGHLLGGIPWYQQTILPTHYQTLILEQSESETSEQQHIGLVVTQVEGIESLSLDSIQSPVAISESLVPFLRGYWLEDNGDMLMLLDSLAIFSHMPE